MRGTKKGKENDTERGTQIGCEIIKKSKGGKWRKRDRKSDEGILEERKDQKYYLLDILSFAARAPSLSRLPGLPDKYFPSLIFPKKFLTLNCICHPSHHVTGPLSLVYIHKGSITVPARSRRDIHLTGARCAPSLAPLTSTFLTRQ